MFFIILFLKFQRLSTNETHIHVCDHHEIQKSIDIKEQTVKTTRFLVGHSQQETNTIHERQPIRITLDFLLDSDEDPLQCTQVNQTVFWRGGFYICTESDLVENSDQKKENLKQTMENVRDYLQNLLYVDRVTEPFEIDNHANNYFTLPSDRPLLAENTDFYLTVFIRTFGTLPTIASAHAIQRDSLTKRPIQGSVYFHSKYLPTDVQNESSLSTDFFYITLHEIIHALGVSEASYKYFHPKEDNTPYENPLCELLDEETGKKHTFLVTPYSHKFAVMQWGVEEFISGDKNCTSGIELEDGGNSGTAMTHPEARIGNQDLMVGVTIQGKNGPYQRLTPLTAALLLDTGNYDINWSKVQPLVWGNKDSIDGNYIKNFVMGPPAEVFPQQYIYRPNADPYLDACGFTFKMIGVLNLNTQFSCPASSSDTDDHKAYCEAEKFYNPNGDNEIGGNWPYDFQIIHLPTHQICSEGSACISGLTGCYQYTIDENNESFTLTLPNGVEYGTPLLYQCNSSNVGKITNYYDHQPEGSYVYNITCPPIKQFINTVRMMENQQYLTENPFEDNPPLPSQSEFDSEIESETYSESSIHSESNNQEQSEKSDGESTKPLSDGALAAIICVSVIILLLIPTVLLILHFKNKKDLEIDDAIASSILV